MLNNRNNRRHSDILSDPAALDAVCTNLRETRMASSPLTSAVSPIKSAAAAGTPSATPSTMQTTAGSCSETDEDRGSPSRGLKSHLTGKLDLFLKIQEDRGKYNNNHTSDGGESSVTRPASSRRHTVAVSSSFYNAFDNIFSADESRRESIESDLPPALIPTERETDMSPALMTRGDGCCSPTSLLPSIDEVIGDGDVSSHHDDGDAEDWSSSASESDDSDDDTEVWIEQNDGNNLIATEEADYAVFATWAFNTFDHKDHEVQLRYAVLMLRHFAKECAPEDGVSTDPVVLGRFCSRIMKAYKDNPYHTWEHALTVTHAVFMLLTDGHVDRFLSPLECFSLIVAAAGHDLGHPGWTNEVECKMIDDCQLHHACIKRREALRMPSLSDRSDSTFSLLESYHALRTCKIMAKPGSCLIAEDAPDHVRETVRHTIITAIMATDMQCHKDLVKAVEKRAKTLHTGQPFSMPASEADRELIIRNILHAADISNPFLSFQTSAKWARLIVDEMVQQKQAEFVLLHKNDWDSIKNESEKNDVETMASIQAIADSQVFFVGEICIPYFQQLVTLFPDMQSVVDRGQGNLAIWKDTKTGTPLPEGVFSDNDDLDEDRQNRARLRIAAAAKSPYSGTCVLKSRTDQLTKQRVLRHSITKNRISRKRSSGSSSVLTDKV